MKLKVTTLPELVAYAKKELKSQGIKIKKTKKDYLEIECDNTQLLNFISTSHFVDRIYDNEEDIIGFSLFSRDILHIRDEKFPIYLVDMALVDLRVKIDDKIIDPLAGYGDIILEAGVFLYNSPLHQKKTTIFEKQNSISSSPSKINSNKNQLTAIVQENIEFKKIQENARFLRLKPRCSKFELDWLDVKFHKGDFDYVITKLPGIESSPEFEKEFFYQCEFISKKRLIVFSSYEIPHDSYKGLLKKVSLKEISGFYYYIFK